MKLLYTKRMSLFVLARLWTFCLDFVFYTIYNLQLHNIKVWNQDIFFSIDTGQRQGFFFIRNDETWYFKYEQQTMNNHE